MGCYRYGFNGKEQDGDIDGTGVDYDYGFRIYDGRIGRFLSVDPLQEHFPWNSDYAFSEGDPINYIDLDGREKAKSNANAGNQSNTAALATAMARGAKDASMNAVGMGIPDALGLTNNLSDYKDVPEQIAYLRGRQMGDAASLTLSAFEIAASKQMVQKGGQMALSTGAETEGVGAAAGGVVMLAGGATYAHATLEATAASADALIAGNKIFQLNMAAHSSTTNATNSTANSANGGNSGTNNSSDVLGKLSRDGSSDIDLKVGNSDRGLQHILERHEPGTTSPNGKGDLFPEGTSYDQIFDAMKKVYSKGARATDKSKVVQTFTKRIKINGESGNYKLVVDTKQKDVVTFFKMGN